jgi:hypothetical protein
MTQHNSVLSYAMENYSPDDIRIAILLYIICAKKYKKYGHDIGWWPKEGYYFGLFKYALSTV